MLDQIRDFFNQHILAPEHPGEADDEARLKHAAAALLLEMTHVDEASVAAERATVAESVRESFDLDPGEADELLACAEAERREATDYFQFTALINERFDAEAKARLIEALWRVAYADQRLSKFEEHLVRKVAELLYVPHSVFINAKHRAAGEHGGG